MKRHMEAQQLPGRQFPLASERLTPGILSDLEPGSQSSLNCEVRQRDPEQPCLRALVRMSAATYLFIMRNTTVTYVGDYIYIFLKWFCNIYVAFLPKNYEYILIMSCHRILINKLLEFTNEEFGTKGRTKPTHGKLVQKKISFNNISAFFQLKLRSRVAK